MTERAQRLYDCVTEVGDGFLLEAEAFEPRAQKRSAVNWRRWGTLAAAVLLVFGAGRWMLGGIRMGSMEAPAASAPAASAPAEPQEGRPDTESGSLCGDDAGGAAEEQNWGITLDIEDVTPGGVILVCTQSGGQPTGELMTGTAYSLERWEEGMWVPVETKNESIFTQKGVLVPREDTVRWNVDWTWMYGELPEGEYRMTKEFMDFREPGEYDSQTYYAEFVIE